MRVLTFPPPPVAATRSELLFVIPVFNDWPVVALLLPAIDSVVKEHGLDAEVLLVDDASTSGRDEFACPPLEAIVAVQVLALRRNLGHQRAIAVGLAFARHHMNPRTTLVMDADGEDDPRDVPALLGRLEEEGRRKVIFAERQRRSEPLLFRVLYRVYRVLHRVLTGAHVKVGNFSVVPDVALARLVVVSEMWNHYAAAVFNARIDYAMVPTSRGRRLGGQSHMSLIALVVHGLSALSVYSHVIGVRLLVGTGALVTATTFALAAVVLASIGAGGGVPSWLSFAVGLLAVLVFQAATAGAAFVFLMLAGRQGASFIPTRDYVHFVGGLAEVHRRR